jgi:hypothetical protein
MGCAVVVVSLLDQQGTEMNGDSLGIERAPGDELERVHGWLKVMPPPVG